jgi:hypothetical protein
MNIVLSSYLFGIPHAYPLSQNDLPFFFSEKKKNIIVDGTFTKIVYSNEYFTMNGLYVSFRVCDIQGHLHKDPGEKNERRGACYLQNATSGACSELHKDPGEKNERRGASYSQNATSSQIKTFAPPPNIESPLGKNYIHYDPLLEYNRQQIESLCQLEYHILEMYAVANENHLYKKPVYYLKTQIQYGVIKAHCENAFTYMHLPSHSADSTNTCTSSSLRGSTNTLQSPDRWTKYIKISGVWETDLYYGITYKIICEPIECV